MHGGEFIGLVAVLLIFGWPIALILTGHHRRLVEMKLRMGQQADENVMAELKEMKQQIAQLRDTTTRYDLSFDTALQRLESRMANMEQRMSRIEKSAESAPASQVGR
jgi:galactokinase/mevalonate kinase-like predicted kinase